MDHLVLFDIDATLLKTDGAGIKSMEQAGQELFGPEFTAQGINFAGRLDPLIFRELFELNDLDRTPDKEHSLRARYREVLEQRLKLVTRKAALPGAVNLVRAVRETGMHVAGVLTGNFAETGSMKLAACGFEPSWFEVQAWGDDSPHDPPERSHLVPVAMKRYQQRFGKPVEGERVTIIGDTPHDVHCAQVHGCWSLGVATGQFSVDELRAAGADLVLESLEDTESIVGWLKGE